MPTIGSFGAAVRELDPDAEPFTFDFFGTEFVVHDVIPPMLMLQLGAVIAGKAGIMEGNATVFEVFRTSLTRPAHGDQRADHSQFDRFYELAIAKKCDEDELIRLVWALVGAQADLPTEQLPTSPDGQLPTSESSSSSVSDTPDSPALVSVEERLAGLG